MKGFINFVKFIITLVVTIIVLAATHLVADGITDCIVGKVIRVLWKADSGEEDCE